MEEKKQHTLQNVLQSVQRMFEKYWSRSIWIKVEIAKINYYSHSGHAYPLLVEKHKGKTIAEVRSIIWKRDFIRIKSNFEKVAKKELSDGMEVMILAEVKFTVAHGLSFNILDIDPNYALGEMERERRKTIEKLKDNNLFEKNKQLKLPILIKRVAIISVETSKGYHDFEDTLKSNKNNYIINYELFPALLQGDKAVESIRQQLDNIRQRKKEFDVVAIIRGGGGEVGLNCYDNYYLSSAIAQFPIPIITGIGHATNLTASEMISYKNLITPTALANFIIDMFDSYNSRINNAHKTLINRVEDVVFKENQKLVLLKNAIKSESRYRFQIENQVLNNNESKIALSGNKLIMFQNKKIEDLAFDVKFLINGIITKKNNNLNNTKLNLVVNSTRMLESNKSKLINTDNKLRLLDPINILKRGYSITRIKGLAKNTNNAKLGDILEIETHNLQITSRVEEVLIRLDKKNEK